MTALVKSFWFYAKSTLFCTFICSANRPHCTSGSFGSVYALAGVEIIQSVSVKPGSDLCHFANGLTSGWLMTKVGCMQVSSRKWPTSCTPITFNIISNCRLTSYETCFIKIKGS